MANLESTAAKEIFITGDANDALEKVVGNLRLHLVMAALEVADPKAVMRSQSADIIVTAEHASQGAVMIAGEGSEMIATTCGFPDGLCFYERTDARLVIHALTNQVRSLMFRMAFTEASLKQAGDISVTITIDEIANALGDLVRDDSELHIILSSANSHSSASIP